MRAATGFVRSSVAGYGLLLAAAPFAYGADIVIATPKQIVVTMVDHENAEMLHKAHYVYVSQERSERTGGHLWTERVAETQVGKIRMLMAVDGQPLSGERLTAERARIGGIVSDPAAFQRSAQAAKDDEVHAQAMLNLLPRAFVFENQRRDGSLLRIDFKPNPAYEPQSMEERVLHGMSGSIAIDEQSGRLLHLEGRLPADVSIGFGLLATIKAGSNFSTTRGTVIGNEWKTAVVDTDINGRAVFFKSIGRKEHAEHSEFHMLPAGMTVAQTAQMLIQ